MSELISALGLPYSARGRDLPPWIADFYRAYITRDAELLDTVVDDDIDWLLAGPADQIDFFGRRRGKDAVIEVVTRIMPCYFHLTDFEIEHLLVQGERAAFYGHLRARQRDTGRAIRYRGSHFTRARDGRIVSFRGIADTFDAAEQVVGHPIDVTKRIERVALVPEEDALLSL
jgi:ketosteroid isomerase-like protein